MGLMVKYSEDTIREVCTLRRKGLSYINIGRRLGLSRGQALALVYKHLLKINRHSYYKRSTATESIHDRDTRPSVPFVPGLSDTLWYKLKKKEG